MSKKTKCNSGAGEEGTDQLLQNYENDTPGQGKDKKMKFKDFRKKIKESNDSVNYEVPGSDTDILYIEKPEALQRVNAFIKAVAKNPTLNVYETLAKVRAKLNGVGLDFEPPKHGDPQEMMEFPVSMVGGRNGMGLDGQPLNDDGLESRTGRRWVLRVSSEETEEGYILTPSVNAVEEKVVEESWLPEGIEIDENFDLAEGDAEARELEMFLTNDAHIYRSRLQPIYKNLVTKMAQGKYDDKLAVKAFMYAVDDAAKKYTKEYDAPGAKWTNVFDKKTRMAVATTLASEFKDEADLGNYDDMLPKKYRS